MKILFILLTAILPLLASIGEVTALTGTAQLSRQAEEIDVNRGLKVLENDLIKTASRSKAQVILNDDTVITIGPESEYLFERFQESGDAEVVMRLKRGFFKAVTGRIGKIAPQRFKIKTKAATIGIRGTQFMAHVQDEEEKIGCIQGELIVWTADGEYIVTAGNMLVYKEKRWYLKTMVLGDFTPVMVGMTAEKHRKAYNQHYMPGLQNSYALEEQIIKEYQTGQEPFTFDFDFDSTQQPPAYNP